MHQFQQLISLRAILIAVFMCTSVGSGLAQSGVQVTNWQTFSSLRSVRSASPDAQGIIWAGTAGGVFTANPTTALGQVYTNIDALSSLDITSVAADPNGDSVVAGSFDGGLDVYDGLGVWRPITDIRRATQYQRRRINHTIFTPALLVIATDFGVVLFDRRRNVFTETIDKIATLPTNTPIRAVAVYKDSLWVASDSGLAVVPMSITSLRVPTAWRRVTTAHGLPSQTVRTIVSDGQNLYIASGSTVTRFVSGSFETILTTPSPVLALTVHPNLVVASHSGGIETTSGTIVLPWGGILAGHTSAIINDTLRLAAFVESRGIVFGTPQGVAPVELDAPAIVQFHHVAVDNDGRLWAASFNDASRTAQGASVFDNGAWKNFNSSEIPDFPSDAVYRISPLSDGSTVLGTWGRGAIIMRPNGNGFTQTVLNSSNSALNGIRVDPNFILVGDAQLDRRGTIWMVNDQSLDRMLVSIAEDGTSRSYRNCSDPSNNNYRHLAIDNGGTKWIGSPYGNGLLAYNERTTPDDASDDLCVAIRSGATNLPDNSVTAVRTDRNGAIWVGTARGVAVITSPTALSTTSIPFIRRISVLGTVQVNDLHVDALNNKWIATATGVYVLNEDGTEVLAVISASRSPLLNDNVRSVAVDPFTGRVWFGTTEGLSSAASQSIRPVTEYAIRVYPQPFKPGRGVQLVIDGLAADSDLRVMTANGHVVAALQTRGRQALWDGNDSNGNPVPPGVYMIHAASQSDQGSAVGKVAITR